jgi:hypothetical protein
MEKYLDFLQSYPIDLSASEDSAEQTNTDLLELKKIKLRQRLQEIALSLMRLLYWVVD